MGEVNNLLLFNPPVPLLRTARESARVGPVGLPWPPHLLRSDPKAPSHQRGLEDLRHLEDQEGAGLFFPCSGLIWCPRVHSKDALPSLLGVSVWPQRLPDQRRLVLLLGKASLTARGGGRPRLSGL